MIQKHKHNIKARNILGQRQTESVSNYTQFRPTCYPNTLQARHLRSSIIETMRLLMTLCFWDPFSIKLLQKGVINSFLVQPSFTLILHATNSNKHTDFNHHNLPYLNISTQTFGHHKLLGAKLLLIKLSIMLPTHFLKKFYKKRQTAVLFSRNSEVFPGSKVICFYSG